MEYDLLSDVYELWSTGDPAYYPSHGFYVDIASKVNGLIAEIGVGTGRIALDIARQGKQIAGIDISPKMLEIFQSKAKIQGVQDNIQAIHASAANFVLPEKAKLIYFPFRSIGHLLTEEERKTALLNIKEQLSSSGLLVFDHYIFDESWAKIHDRIPRLMYSGNDHIGNKIYIWDTYLYDYQKQIMNCTITIESINKNCEVTSRKHCPLTFSWINIHQMEKMLKETGYKVIKLLGSFDGREFNKRSTEQIWIVSPK